MILRMQWDKIPKCITTELHLACVVFISNPLIITPLLQALAFWLVSCQIFVYCDHPIGQNEVIEEEPNGKIDFSGAVPQKDGSLCVTKVKYLEKLEKQQVKECWHQNVTGMVPHAGLSIFLIYGKKNTISIATKHRGRHGSLPFLPTPHKYHHLVPPSIVLKEKRGKIALVIGP